MQPLPNIDELLTGLLDGNLTEGELRQVEAAMAADSTLEMQLETLRKMRSDLLIHRPKGRLGADFAKRVTAMAEERARANSTNSVPVVAPKLRLGPWIYAGVASAAVLACILFAMPSAPNTQPFIAKVNLPEDTKAAAPDEIPAVGPLESQLNVTGPLVAEAKPNSPVRIKELEQTNATVGILPPSQNDDDQKKDAADSPKTASNTATPNVGTKSKLNLTDEQRNNEDLAKLNKSKLDENFYTLVVDVSLTKDAIENRVLQTILSRHDIASAEEQILSPEELSNLEKTGLAVRKSGESKGEVGLVFVRAPGTNLNRAIREVNVDQESFPEFRMGMQTDESLKSFVNELGKINVAAESKGQARHLRSTTTDPLMPYSEGSIVVPSILPRAKPKPEGTGRATALKAESKAMSNAILIIRSAK